MMIEIQSQKLLKPLTILCFVLVSLSGLNSANTKCPFQYLYHFGGAVTDIGNAMKMDPKIPAAHPPYGTNYPGGKATGRWSDGLIDFDYAAKDFGLPNIVPYLSMNTSDSVDGIIFSVARSPVLDREFFLARDVFIEPYAVPLSHQITWFKRHISSINCNSYSTWKDKYNCMVRISNSLILLGDIEANDLGYPLVQGKTVEEVKTYVPYIVDAMISGAREFIKMGAARIIIPGNGPLGCYPYVLTALENDNPKAYDHLGCLKEVNDLVLYKNYYLQRAVYKLSKEFPDLFIFYGNIYDGAVAVITDKSFSGTDITLKACCGSGGKYNFNKDKFCGSTGVPVCLEPHKYVFWDGLFFTQDTYARMERALIQPALSALNCTTD